MSGAIEAGSALLTAALRDTQPVKSAVDAYGSALRTLRGQDDLVDQMQATVGFILAAEAVAEAAEAVAKQARAALAFAMFDTGATTIRTDAHTVSVSAKPARAIITDPALVPPDYVRQPPPAPDVALIGKALRDGYPVPGCVLSNSGEPVLSIRTRKAA